MTPLFMYVVLLSQIPLPEHLGYITSTFLTVKSLTDALNKISEYSVPVHCAYYCI